MMKGVRIRIFALYACLASVMMVGVGVTEELDVARTLAARELILAVTADDRILDRIEEIVVEQLPSIRQVTLQTSTFRSYTPEHQAAALAFLDRTPLLFRNEYKAAMEPVTSRISSRISHMMSADDFMAAARAFRADENADLLREAVTAAFAGRRTESAFPDLTGTEAGRHFLASEAGIAFVQARPAMDEIIAEESTELASLGPRVRQSQCPGFVTPWRTSVRPSRDSAWVASELGARAERKRGHHTFSRQHLTSRHQYLDIKTSNRYPIRMRTTLTLEPDVAAQVERLRKERDIALKDVINEALRRGLMDMSKRPKQKEPYQTSVHDGGKLLMDFKEALTLLDEEYDRKKLGL
jgi:hypothetical protein